MNRNIFAIFKKRMADLIWEILLCTKNMSVKI